MNRHIHHALVDLRLGYPVTIAGIAVCARKTEGFKRIVPQVREASSLHERELLALRLAKRAGLTPELWVKESTEQGLPLADVEAFLNAPPTLTPVTKAPVPLPIAAFEHTRVLGFEDGEGLTHLALLIGAPEKQTAPLCRVHSSCITGDVLESLKCDCGTQLHKAIDAMAEAGAGVLIYLNQEGRGIGLAGKLRAYQLQAEGMDTIDANHALGFEADERDFTCAAIMLKSLGISSITLLTNNPNKAEALKSAGVSIAATTPLKTPSNPHNHAYLATKKDRMGHI